MVRASSRSASSARLRSVMSRATFDAPMILPPASWIGETVSDTSTRPPSLRVRCVSKWSTCSPRADPLWDPGTSSGWSGGTNTDSGRPTTSAAAYP